MRPVVVSTREDGFCNIEERRCSNATGWHVSVKLLDNVAFYGYRVRRTVHGKKYQEYFSLKFENGRLRGRAQKAVEQAALRRDAELAQLQETMRRALKADRSFNNAGLIRGLTYLIKTNECGTVTPILRLSIASELERKFFCTTISLNAHSNEEAWQKAIDTYAKHKSIRKHTNLYRQLLAAKSRYIPTDLNTVIECSDRSIIIQPRQQISSDNPPDRRAHCETG